MELGKIQSLKVDRKKDFGVYLTDGNGEDVLLPMKEVPEGCEVGSEIEFLYIVTVKTDLLLLPEDQKF